MATKYTIECWTDRGTALKYATWWLGLNRALELVNKLPVDCRGRVNIVHFPALNPPKNGKRVCSRWADRFVGGVKSAVAWQEGRLGQEFNGGQYHICLLEK